MEIITKLSWLALGLIHLPPALSAMLPALREKLYGSIDPNMSLLLSHRGVLFGVLVVLSAMAILFPNYRKPAVIALSISMIGFLWLYAAAGFPEGPMRKIATADAAGLLPLAIAAWAAFRA